MALAAPGPDLPWEAPFTSISEARAAEGYPALRLTLSLPSGWPWLLARCPLGSKEPWGSGGPLWAGILPLAGLPQSLIIVTGRVSVSILPAFGQKKKGKRRERREWREQAEGRL